MKHRRTSHFRNEDAEATALGDLTMNPLMIFFFLFVIVTALLVTRAKQQEESSTLPDLGRILIEIEWPAGATDIDLWMLEPSSKKPTGFSNRGGRTCDLLRDDLGERNDRMPGNHESILCRTAPPGEYTLAAYYYTNYADEEYAPITVSASISVWNDARRRFVRAYATKLELQRPRTYRTIASFTMRENGTLDKDSIHTIERNIFAEGPP